MDTTHQDAASILMLDRPAIRWRTLRTRGYAWSEGPVGGRRVASWRDAACDLAACGLVADRGRRRVHSSVSGSAPIYYVQHGEAVYFASRIDPLVQALGRRLTIDWRAWSSILHLRFPLGNRTPFREVKRLRPFSVLEWNRDQSLATERQAPWPWAQVDCDVGLDEGADAVVDAMRVAVAPLTRVPVTCPLSGGLDSRLLVALLAEGGHDGLRAVTVSPDTGMRGEEDLAEDVASRLGVPHAIVTGEHGHFWRDVREQALRSDFQLAFHPGLMPLATSLSSQPGVVPHGLALDTFAQRGGRFYTEAMTRPDGSDATARALWAILRRGMHERGMRRALSRDFGDTTLGLARRQFMRETRPFRGHPAEPVLIFYATRTVRGISLVPQTILGRDLATVTPFTDHRVALSCLSIDPPQKFDAALYRALFSRVSPALGELLAPRDVPPPRRSHPRRGRSSDALRGYEEILADGPLTGVLSPAIRRRLAKGRLRPALRDPGLKRGLVAVAQFHLWHERYRSVLSTGEPLELLELPRAHRAPRREAAAWSLRSA
jgi:hypothetical protein